MRTAYFVFAMAVLMACQPQPAQVIHNTVNIDSLIAAQEHLLTNQRPQLIKRIFLNGKSDSLTATPDSMQWKNELQALHDLSIVNRPAYQTSFSIQRRADDHSNLEILEWSPTEPMDIQGVRFFYHTDLSHLKRIEFLTVKSNLIMTVRQSNRFEFDEQNHQPRLIAYTSQRRQQLTGQSPDTLSVQAHLTYSSSETK